MPDAGSELDHRRMFAERFALLYAAAGDPPLKRIAESVARARRMDEQGRPTRVSLQRLSDWRRGRNVPARFSALAATLEVLIGEARKARPAPVTDGLYDLAAWRTLWERAQSSPVAVGDDTDEANGRRADSGVCPYRGLASFREEDSDWFFGRDRSTSALLARLAETAETDGIVMLVGASGSGKSSVLRAGVGAALAKNSPLGAESRNWPVITMAPGGNPLETLADNVPDLADVLSTAMHEEHGDEADEFSESEFASLVRQCVADYVARESGPGTRLVLIVDQFEEIFTLCESERRRQLFVQAVRAACTSEKPGDTAPALAVLGVRADFYGQCLDYPELAQALQDRQMVLGAMTAAELSDAITRPAKAVGIQFETGLLDLIVRDLGMSSSARTKGGAYDAGALPLLSHALLATWQRRQAGKLTVAGYRATGGIHGAVAVTAERAWDNLTPPAQQAAHDLLLRLVHVGRNTRDTRRRSTRDEILAGPANQAAAEEALEALTRARLVTMDADSVEISHEALLQAWPRLRTWIDEDRAGNLARQRLEEDAAAWAAGRRDPSLLYRGAHLESALDRAGDVRPTGIAQEFLDISARHRRRATWTRHAAVGLVCTLAIVAGVAAVTAINERNEARFRQILAEADRLQASNPSLSAQLNLVALRMRPDDQEVYSRLISTQNTPLATPVVGHDGPVYETTFSPDGQTLATAGYDNTVRLWNIQDPTRPKPLGTPLTAHTSWVTSAVFSPDGRVLATAGDDEVVRLWDVTDPAHPTPLGRPLTGDHGTIYSVSYSADGSTIATANDDHTVGLWDVTDPGNANPLGEPLRGHTAPVRSVDFSPDGRTLATAGNDKTVRLWDVTDLGHPTPLGQPVTGNNDDVHSVEFSPDSRVLATAGEDKTVRLWNVAAPAFPVQLGQPITTHSAAVWEVGFSPDGALLASASADSTTRLWNLADPANPILFGQPLTASASGVNTAQFSPDGRTLATGTYGDIANLWSFPPTVLFGHSYWVSSLEFSRDGRLLATGSGDKTARLWDVTDPTLPEPAGPALAGHDTYVNNVALSPDGRTLATAGGDQKVQLWNVTAPGDPEPAGPPVALNSRFGGLVAFSPDGRVLATLNGQSILTFWDVSTPGQPEPLGNLDTEHTKDINELTFGHGQRLLATTGNDRTMRLWDVADPAKPQLLSKIRTGHTGDVKSATFSPDDRVLATTSADKTIRLWDVANPRNPTLLGRPLTGHTESVNSSAFTPDGSELATTSTDKTIRLWDVADAANAHSIGMISGRMEVGYTAAFIPGTQLLATGTGDNLIWIWDLDEKHAIERICATTRNVLTPQIWEQHLPELSYKPPCP
jgi:WD40 repeat protein